METVRAGMTLQLKEAVGCDFIAEREETLMRRVRGWMAQECFSVVITLMISFFTIVCFVHAAISFSFDIAAMKSQDNTE